MRRWRSTLSSLSIIFMLFGVGTAMAPTVESAPPLAATLEMRVGESRVGSSEEALLTWPEDFCLSPCASPPTEPYPEDRTWRPFTTTTTTTAPPPTTAAKKAAVPAVPLSAPRPVEEWRALVSAYFAAADVELALNVISCESGGDPNAVNPASGAAGLFQHIPRY